MPGSTDSGAPRFPATAHSVVAALAADDPAIREPAFEAIVESYWKPVYKYLRVARRLADQDAEDLTQEFFLRAFTKGTLAGYDQGKARFRTFLRVCLDRFAANAGKAERRLKRGGGRPLIDLGVIEREVSGDAQHPSWDPETYFRREWVRTLFESALRGTEEECRTKGRETPFQIFVAYDIDPPGDLGRPSYDDLARRHGVAVTQVTNYLSAVRRIFRRAVLDRLKAITGSDQEFAAEAREILGVEVE